MAPLKVGDAFPDGVSFTYVPTGGKKEDVTACGNGIKYNASTGKKTHFDNAFPSFFFLV